MADIDLPATLTEQPDWAAELDETSEELPERAHAWSIGSLGEADWSMRMLAGIERQASGIEQQAKLWRARIDLWEVDELRRLTARRALFRHRLEEWGLDQREADPKRATFALPSGTVKTRQMKEPTVEIVDEEAVLEWAKDALTVAEYDKVVKVRHSVLVTELRKLVIVDTTEPSPRQEGLPWAQPIYRVVHPDTKSIVPGLVVHAPVTTAKVEVEL